MLSQDPFYFGSIRKVVVAFGSLFSDLHIIRQDSYGNLIQPLKVPLSWGPKEKFLYRIKQQPMPNVNDQVEMVLPRMSYEIRNLTYDEARKLNSIGQTSMKATTGNAPYLTQLNPVPYNIQFELNIMVKTIEDGLMIIEQILPFFSPDYTVTVKDIPQLALEKDIPFILNGISNEDTWEGDFKDRRSITYTLAFTAKAYLYPPILTSKIILSAGMNIYLQGGAMPPVVNFTDTVDPITANADDVYTIDETMTEIGSTHWIAAPRRAFVNVAGTYQFALAGGDSTLTLTPNVGTINSSGLYTAPDVISEDTSVVLRNTLNRDSTLWSEAFITLVAGQVAVTAAGLGVVIAAGRTEVALSMAGGSAVVAAGQIDVAVSVTGVGFVVADGQII